MSGGLGNGKPEGRGGIAGGDSTSITLREGEAVERLRKNDANGSCWEFLPLVHEA